MTGRLDREQAGALALGTALVASVLWPVRYNWREERRDGFPLSYYPMFSAKRRRTGSVVHLLGLEADGTRHRLSYELAGVGGLNQVRKKIARQVELGRAEQLAQTVAASPRLPRGVCEVRVVTGSYRYDEFFAGSRVPRREVEHARAAVGSTHGAVDDQVGRVAG